MAYLPSVILFGKMSVHVFCPFTPKGFVCLFSLLGFEGSLYIVPISPLFDLWFAYIFSQCVSYLFTFLTVFQRAEAFIL